MRTGLLRAIVGALLATVSAACWVPAAEPARVRAPATIVLEGDEPEPWRVEAARGSGDRWCVAEGFGGESILELGDPCNELVGPAGVPQPVFGPGGATTDAQGLTVSWGTVVPLVDQVVLVFSDDTRLPAQIRTGPGAFKLWAASWRQPGPTHIEALGAAGQLLAALPL